MCDRELNAFRRSPAVLHELGRHPDSSEQDESHDQPEEHLEGVRDVGVAAARVGCDAEGADAGADRVVSVAGVADLVPFVGRVDDGALFVRVVSGWSSFAVCESLPRVCR